MGLSYHFKLTAPGEHTAAELERFLKSVEASTRTMGFNPTMVLDARFDSEERRTFARRLTRGLVLEDSKLKGLALTTKDQVWHHDPVEGYCRIIPERGVVLIVTDERKCESVFGFFQYPKAIVDAKQRVIAKSEVSGGWVFENSINSPDPRYRHIVKLFADAGYVEVERDDFSGCKLPRPC